MKILWLLFSVLSWLLLTGPVISETIDTNFKCRYAGGECKSPPHCPRYYVKTGTCKDVHGICCQGFLI